MGGLVLFRLVGSGCKGRFADGWSGFIGDGVTGC